MRIAVVMAAVIMARVAHAKPLAITCPSGTVLVANQSNHPVTRTTALPNMRILARNENGRRMVKVAGPTFGSMDSPRIATALSCGARGVTVTRTVTRSARYLGQVAKNLVWYPSMMLSAKPGKAVLMLTVQWNVRLSNGREVNSRHTHSGEHYPVVLSRAIRP